MKNTIIFLLLSLFILNACNDEDIISEEKQLEIDIDKIENYLIDNGLYAESTESGLHYIIEVEGTGSHPTVDSTIKVTYTGKYLNGEVFSSGTEEYILINLLPGWQEGIPFFKEGGSGMLFIPSVLGYGSSDYFQIPGNSVLIFDIELLSVTY